MNGSSLGSNLWTDHVEVDVYICPWCGRMAFFEPEDVREKLAALSPVVRARVIK